MPRGVSKYLPFLALLTGSPAKRQFVEVHSSESGAGPMSLVAPPNKPPRRDKGSSRRQKRERLPEKLWKHLCVKPIPDTLWWMTDGNGFAFNTENVQVGLLDPFFKGTKLTSFIRSLNRW